MKKLLLLLTLFIGCHSPVKEPNPLTQSEFIQFKRDLSRAENLFTADGEPIIGDMPVYLVTADGIRCCSVNNVSFKVVITLSSGGESFIIPQPELKHLYYSFEQAKEEVKRR